MDAGRYLRNGYDKAMVLGYKVSKQFQKEDRSKTGRQLGSAKTSCENTDDVKSMNDEKEKGLSSPDLLHKMALIKLERFTGYGREETKTERFRVVGIMAETSGRKDVHVVIPLKFAQEIVC